jgi:hypothetical protein
MCYRVIPPDPFSVLEDVVVPLLERFAQCPHVGVLVEESLAKEALP